jgi:hypothetical protein
MVKKFRSSSLGSAKTPGQFSWIDQCLVQDRHIEQLEHAAGALYLFLVTVADAIGFSCLSTLSDLPRNPS